MLHLQFFLNYPLTTVVVELPTIRTTTFSI